MKLYEKSRKEALAMMKDTDKKRSINYAYHTEQKWGDTRNYALCMNSSILGYETCMELIKKVWNKSILLHIPDRLQAPEARTSQFHPSEAPRMLC